MTNAQRMRRPPFWPSPSLDLLKRCDWLVTFPERRRKTFSDGDIRSRFCGGAGKWSSATATMLLISVASVALSSGCISTLIVGPHWLRHQFRVRSRVQSGKPSSSAFGLAGLGGFAWWNDRSRMRRSRQSAFGDQMDVDGGGAVDASGDRRWVVGEAYRVDQDSGPGAAQSQGQDQLGQRW